MRLKAREKQTETVEQNIFDITIIGGGISGAVIFRCLAERGFRVLLLEKGDFAGGTSQSSAMMVWGNLTELRSLSLLKVARGCASRENLIKQQKDFVFPQKFRYLPIKNGRQKLSSFAAFYAYWILGAGKRTLPHYRQVFPETSFLRGENFPYSFEYEEAVVDPSDARFVLSRLLSRQNFLQTALNYQKVSGGNFDSSKKLWLLEVSDLILQKEFVVKTRFVVNAAGIWTDELNKQFGIFSPYKHIFGKGVFLGIKRPAKHLSTLMIETCEAEGCLALIPWGPISLWGPTETRVRNVEEGFCATRADIGFLINQINRHFSQPVTKKDIISLRCGVRPLPVDISFPEDQNTLSIPREYKVHKDKNLPWISIYGGKLTSSLSAAQAVKKVLQDQGLKPTLSFKPESEEMPIPEFENFPNLTEKVLSARWCAEKEMCWSLEDYLRRRTNIAQWIPRGGLGFQNENLSHLKKIAGVFCDHDELKISQSIKNYQTKIQRDFDAPLK